MKPTIRRPELFFLCHPEQYDSRKKWRCMTGRIHSRGGEFSTTDLLDIQRGVLEAEINQSTQVFACRLRLRLCVLLFSFEAAQN
jgi:hypothetical protein